MSKETEKTPNDESNKTDFGYQKVDIQEKTAKVAEVFNSVAARYDLMNDIMSFGIHRWWKYLVFLLGSVKKGDIVLDVAGGTGDLAEKWQKKVGKEGHVYLADINANMLHKGRDRLIDKNKFFNVSLVQADAEALPFPDNYFNWISIAFGLRNMTCKEQALSSMWRVLKPGGQLLILEFSTPTFPLLKKIYDSYSLNLIPKLGRWIANDEKSYRYLVESIRRHPPQEQLKDMMLSAGFDRSEYLNLTGGIVALHRGWKY